MESWLMLLSDVFSIITLLLCLILKVPQIMRLIKSGEASGLNLGGLLLELSAYTVTMMYNYCNGHSLLSYMEYPIIILQQYVLIYVVMHYKNFKSTSFYFVTLIYILISLAFGIGIVDKFILTLFLPFTTPVGAISKIIQLKEIISSKNSYSVSVFTWFLSFFTNATRIYTVFMDSADINLMLNFTISSMLSGVVMSAALYYQKYPVSRTKNL